MNNQQLSPVQIRGQAVIRNNWYALRNLHDGKLLMVGPYMPAPAMGVSCRQVAEEAVPALLEELRKRLGEAPQVMELEGHL